MSEDSKAADREGKKLPSYVSFLAKAIATAPDTPRLWSSGFDYQSTPDKYIRDLIGYFNSLLESPNSGMRIMKLVESLPDLGVEIVEKKLTLRPTGSNKLPFDPPILMHKGHITIRDAGNRLNDNMANLAKHGVFGAPDFDRATYLQTFKPQFQVVANKNPRLIKSEPVCLFIDPKKLADKRSIYPDPEGFLHQMELGNSFFILGGIPAAAIIAISEYPDGQQIPILPKK